MLLTVFLASATFPALNSWIHHNQGSSLEAARSRLEAGLQNADRPGISLIPHWWARKKEPLSWFDPNWPFERLEVSSEVVFSAAVLDAFEARSTRESEFKAAVGSPEAPEVGVTDAGVALRWRPPEGLVAVRSELAENPLLDLRFRIYRWREGEDPQLLTSLEVTQNFFLDKNLPLWRDQYFYCVATVLEGKLDEVPTLIESKPSPVISVETRDRFSLQVLDGTGDRAEVEVSAQQGGRWIRQTFQVAPGERIGATSAEESADLGPFDTGLTLLEIDVREVSEEVEVQRPVFLPDGRREVDAQSGLPTFRTRKIPASARILELRCKNQALQTREYTSEPLP
jgi:hypothetical protein